MLRLFLYALAVLSFSFRCISGEAEPEPIEVAAELRGCWQKVDEPNVYMWLTARRCIQTDGKWHGGDRAKMSDGALILGESNPRKIQYKIANGILDLNGPRGKLQLRKLEKVPDELENLFKPMTLGLALPLKKEKIAAISKEIEKRYEKDQAVRQEPAKPAEILAVDAENEKYIVALLQDVGWIDVDRFDPLTSHNAWLMMMHYVDNWPLMLAVLPEIKRDVLAKKFEADSYSRLFDRVRWTMGEPYRYAQMITVDNTPTMGPFEDFEKADDYRKEIGLPSVAEELKRYPKESLRLIKK